MELVYATEREDFRRGLSEFLDARCTPEYLRGQVDSPSRLDQAMWRAMTDQMDLPGLIVPERFGGSGYGQRELVLVMEETGRALLPGPLFASVALAANLLLAADDASAAGDYLPAIARGDLLATVGLREGGGGPLGPQSIGVSAVADSGQWRLTGRKELVVSAPTSGLALIVARSDAGISLFALDCDAPGVRIERTSALDLTRELGSIGLSEAPARLVGRDGDGWSTVSRMLELATIALAAEQVGGAQAALDMAVAYGCDRIQFGRPIGSFQAVKHRLADVATQVVRARACVYHAGWAADAAADDLPTAASLAGATASEAFMAAASANIQLHGAIGYTWEHLAHLYFKRAKSSQLLFGGPDRHRARLAAILDLEVSESPPVLA